MGSVIIISLYIIMFYTYSSNIWVLLVVKMLEVYEYDIILGNDDFEFEEVDYEYLELYYINSHNEELQYKIKDHIREDKVLMEHIEQLDEKEEKGIEKMVFKLSDERGNCVYTQDSKLAMEIFNEYSNSFNTLEIVKDDDQEVVKTIDEFNNYFY